MGLFQFLIVVQAIIAAALVGVILMQRSEGGGLGMGGSPGGLMSARGAADFMTRTTTILATLFVGLSIGLAFVAAQQGTTSKLDTSLERTKAPAIAPDAPNDPAAGPDTGNAAPAEAPVGGEIPVE
jgi:preprotein translocase subunit SecG